jgi:hypothetical protein
MDDLDQDHENIPPTGRRPDYLNRLKARPQDNQNIVPIVVNPETEDEEAQNRRLAQEGSVAEALRNLFHQLFSSKFNSQLPVNGPVGVVPQQNSQDSPPPIFTAPKRQSVSFVAEIPRVEGIADEDSYLFITGDKSAEDVLQFKGWRAFVVSKSDPTKQHEVSLSNVDFDTEVRHEFRAKLGPGHDFVINYSSDRALPRLMVCASAPLMIVTRLIVSLEKNTG